MTDATTESEIQDEELLEESKKYASRSMLLRVPYPVGVTTVEDQRLILEHLAPSTVRQVFSFVDHPKPKDDLYNLEMLGEEIQQLFRIAAVVGMESVQEALNRARREFAKERDDSEA